MTTFNIITPSYNQDKFLLQTILAVLKQEGNFKLNYLIMDGASTDASKKILKIFKNKISFESKKDQGQSHAINKGIKKILGKRKIINEDSYFAFINSDDYYLPNAFSWVAKAFKKYPDKMWLLADAQIINEKGLEIQFWIRIYKKILRFFPIAWTLPILNPIPQPTVFVRLKAIKQIGFFDQKLNYVMDYDYWWRLLKLYGEPIKLNDLLAAFRIHPNSKGGSQFVKQFTEELKIAKKNIRHPLHLNLHKWHNNIINKIYKIVK